MSEETAGAVENLELTLQGALEDVKLRRPELKDAYWVDHEPSGGSYITAYVAYLAVDRGDGIVWAKLAIGFKTRAFDRIGFRKRIDAFFDYFADALRDGTVPEDHILRKG